jgi:uncharacterized protein
MRDLIKVGCVALVLSLSLAAPVAAGPLEDASADYERRRSANAEALAAYNRGDYATALRLWRPLADQGNASAQISLGLMYANGHGVPQDYAEVVKWYRKAADRGNAAAQINLGLMYANGHGVPQDYAEAVKWYRKAADRGNAAAQNNLGTMYDLGQGVPQDYVEAHKWYNLAAASFPASETESREKAIMNRDRVAGTMTAAQIGEAQRLAREWKPK